MREAECLHRTCHRGEKAERWPKAAASWQLERNVPEREWGWGWGWVKRRREGAAAARRREAEVRTSSRERHSKQT